MPINSYITLRHELDGQPFRRVRILEKLSLHGIPGFALHTFNHGAPRADHKPSPSFVYRVSHIETGSMIGEGETRQQAIDRAEFKSVDRETLLRGIERMRSRIGSARTA